MGDEAAQSEAAQAVEDQGAENQSGNDLYSGFLDGIPEGIHDQVIPALKAQDAEFTKRFQSRAEQVKPYEELGVFDMDPENIGAYLSLDQAVNAAQEGDEGAKQAVQEWWDQMGEALGFYDSDGEEGESGDEPDEDFDPYDPASIQKLISEQLEQSVGPIAQHIQERETQEQQQQALEAAEAAIEAQVEELKESNPNLSDDDVDEILTMAQLFTDQDDPIGAGFEKYKALVSKGENSVFDSKVNQPSTPEGSGPTVNNNAVEATSANVKDLVMERLNKAQALSN
jgi:hypothetical protein